MAYSTIPRFVAGAVCPRCAAMDRIQVYHRDGKDYRECIECGFKQELHIQPQLREPDTRVNRTQEERAEEEQVVKILKPE
ncbi:YheV family putative zinc ribbon protein [Marinimicrobium sp. ABcell2]|uniref:YheV family putative zinc ribbon protein n=1 Tax=Marinimicrobium sp. ABcell2 TaxID=3069751 RepID=UPI0027B0AB59|nr:YheV family putative zinc ribbon protein [Marinimicrobium sp. ABcell2]MDQ2078393.1 YheV family putative zinc ribbon protein [Marinimicrobium sp. ABcell2]